MYRTYRLTITAEQAGGIDTAVGVTVHLKRGWFGQSLAHEFTVEPPNESSGPGEPAPLDPFG
jgi:hypothetical protein